mmetsp:Transcript_60165/g.179140  ORF Transcript_60165/g.179140 Transcript_60165/m.179140 type:complete len:599 (+) Transcript_60165:104-1900(+)
MGYFVQIANDVGSPVFQAAKNYPDVSFASSALFHALVTASLEQGFVPSVLRAQDATIALSVHGPKGGRISIALVTSELAAGQTRDLEAELHWRMGVVYRGALLIAGGELLRRQPVEPLRRLLSQRLAPIVANVMAEEPLPGMGARVPRLGLALCGTAVEWLACSRHADAALDGLLACLPAGSRAGGGGLAPAGALAVLAWRGRALAATPAWQRLSAMDRALLLSLAEEVGPGSFERPGRSWALEEVDRLWLPTAGAGSMHATGAGGASEAEALRPHGVRLQPSHFSETSASARPQQYRLLSVRLFPSTDALGDPRSIEACASCCDWMGTSSGTTTASSHDAAAGPLAGIDQPPSPAEVACFQAEEVSLVFSLLEPEVGEPGSPALAGSPHPANSEAASGTSADDLFASAELCGEKLQDLWRGLGSGDGGESLLRCSSGDLIAAVLVHEASQDTILLPSPVHRCTQLPWTCLGRQRKAAAARRLLYWIHALPQLSLQRSQQYICCETYAVGAVRREDGVHCWGIVDLDLDPDWQGGPLGEETAGGAGMASLAEKPDGRTSPDDGRACRVLSLVAELMQRLPRSSDLRTAVDRLEARGGR